MAKDIQHLTLSGIDDAGAKQYEQAVQALYDYRPGIVNYLTPINDAYPDFVMGKVLLAYSVASEGRYSVLRNVSDIADELNALYASSTKREQKHIDAVNAWAKANLKGAIEIWDAILSEWPHDLVAFRQMTLNLFWMGQRRRLADLCARLMPFWDESTPQYGFFIGPVGFVMEEIGHYELAEKYARHAAEINPSDMWAVHAVAHVLEMQGRTQEGIEWIEPKSHVFHEHNAFVGHLWWHLALFHLESNNIDNVLALFDTQIYPGHSDFYLDIQNGASLLSRLSFLGVDVGERWTALLDAVEANKLDYLFSFTDVHAAIVLAQNGRKDSLDRFNEGMLKRLSPSSIEPWLSHQLTQSISDFHNGKFDLAAERLAPIRYDQLALGGSHAQQDLFLQYQIMAYKQAGNLPMMKAALKERLAKRTIGDNIEGFLANAKAIDRLTHTDNINRFLQKLN